MKKITVIAGSLPKRIIHKEPDSAFHQVLRQLAYTLILSVSVVGVVVYFNATHAPAIHPFMQIGIFLVFSLAAIDRLIRPGKGKVWLLSLAITPVLLLLPLLIVIVPALLLFVQYLGIRMPKREPEICSGDLYEIW